MNIWDPSNETLDREELRQLQLERLQASIFRAYSNVAFYRKRFDGLGIAPEDIESLDDLRRLPFTTKDDLCAGYPYDLLAVPLREVVRLHSPAWATGRPSVCAFTRNDLRHWHECIARLLTAAGVTRDDVVQILFGSGTVSGGLGFHGGAERIGASVIPAASNGITQQLAIMQDFKTTAIVSTASDAIHLAEMVAEKGLDTRRLSLRAGLFGAEPWSERTRAVIEERLGIIALDNFGLSEVGGPGVAGECAGKCGLHLAEDHYLAEIIDPETGEALPEGAEGELVLTTLTKEALPLVRLRTHNITRLNTRSCECGRTTARIDRLVKRTDGVYCIAGKKLHPAQVEAIIADVEGAHPNFVIAIERKAGVEEVEIYAELAPNVYVDTPGKVLAIEGRIQDGIRRTTGLTPRVRMMEGANIARLAANAPGHVIDKREAEVSV
ncbi:MAG: phenylacetate--CoA ligase family protein [Armatimonadota bacterium]